MSLKRWFGRGGGEGEAEEYRDYTLETMKKGYLVDYDLKTWEVTGYATYDYDGSVAQEWELRGANEVWFLEREEDDGETEWTLTRKIQLGEIREDVAGAIEAQDDPPEELHFEDALYKAVESGAGLYRAGGDDPAREFVNWSYESGEDRVLFVSQWGERDFSAYAGTRVEEYQFTDILPGGQT